MKTYSATDSFRNDVTHEIDIPGGKLCVRTGETETAWVSVFFIPEGTKTEFDIAFIESYYNDNLKGSSGGVGEINAYIYDNIETEEWQHKFTVKVRDIDRVCNEGGRW